jgi:hypothetical protein
MFLLTHRPARSNTVVDLSDPTWGQIHRGGSAGSERPEDEHQGGDEGLGNGDVMRR